MIAYIIKSSLCLLFLWAFYKLFLEKENIHFTKRFYLLFSLVFALVIPLISLTYQTEIIVEPEVISETIIPIMIEPEMVMIEESSNYMPMILWSIYGIGVLIFGFRFLWNIRDISKKIRKNERLKESSHINVLLSNSIVPHTFLKYIFVPKKEFQQKNIPEEVLLHEKTHVVQKHTLDILFVEVLQVIFWFNPLFILIKKSVKLNHEFLADRNVLKQQFSIQNYIDLLLNYPNSSNQVVLSSPINYSLTKKRLQMMTKEFSKKRVVLKLVALVPILSLCILFFNNEIVAKEVERPFDEIINREISNSDIQEKAPIIVLKDKERSSSINENHNNFQDGVTEEMVKEYNTWAKDLNSKIKGNKKITIRKNEMDRMQYIYKNMTSDQRNRAEQFPDIDMPPPPPAPGAKKVKKGGKSDIPPPPPPPPGNPKAPSQDNGSYVDVKFSEKSNLTEEEKEAYIERIEATLAKERAEIEKERANLQQEEAMLRVEAARQEQELTSELAMLSAEAAREVAEKARAIAMEAANSVKEDNGNQQQTLENAKISREAAEKARVMALETSRNARQQAGKARELASRQAREARSIAQEEARLARELSLRRRESGNSRERDALIRAKKAEKAAIQAQRKARKAALQSKSTMLKAEAKSRKAMREAEKAARKAEREVRKRALEAEMKARKSQQQAMILAETRSPNKFIENMAKEDADFYYQGKQISAREALKLVEGANSNLSIDASTKNGKSKVTIKD